MAVVTGASRGIGLAISAALAAAGCNLVITARGREALRAAARKLSQLGVQVQAEPCDVRDPRSVARLFRQVRKHFRRVDALINNAGIAGPTRQVAELSLADWRTVLDTNLTGMFLCTRAALPLMARGASIVNNLSISAKGVFPGLSAYNASKHGAAGFTNTLREELRQRGIRVIGLYPGATDTEIWKQFWPEAPRRRMIHPETVAEAVLYALTLPPEATVEELVITPTGGAL